MSEHLARGLQRLGRDLDAEPLGVVDPDAWRLPSGKIRLAYLSGFTGGPGAPQRSICVAESKDGVRFGVVARALAVPEETDPSVVRLGRGSWLMAISHGRETELARSSDGKRFTRFAEVAYGGVPELASLGAGRVRLYVCSGPGIESYRSDDRGETWRHEAMIVPAPPDRGYACDPSRVAGTNVFLYKTGRAPGPM